MPGAMFKPVVSVLREKGIIRVVLRVEVRVGGGWDVMIGCAFWKEGTREMWGGHAGGYFSSLSEGPQKRRA